MSGEMGAGNKRVVRMVAGLLIIHAGGSKWTPFVPSQFKVGDRVRCLFAGANLLVRPDGAEDGAPERWIEC